MKSIYLTLSSVKKLLASLAKNQINQSVNRSVDAHNLINEPAENFFDSLEWVSFCSVVYVFFQLANKPSPPELSRAYSLTKLAEIIHQSTEGNFSHFGFKTSGSQGQPKLIIQSAHKLLQESSHWASHLYKTKRILSFVEPIHIYGFIWTILLSQTLEVDCNALLTHVTHASKLVVHNLQLF